MKVNTHIYISQHPKEITNQLKIITNQLKIITK